MKLPLRKDLIALLRHLKTQIGDEYRASDDDTEPSMCVTVGWSEDGNWSYQTGDNSFSGGAYLYPHWSVVTLYRSSNAVELAKIIRDDLAELATSE